MIILDFGSATTCKNDIKYVERMIDELKAVDSGKHEIIIKWQLFTDIPPVPPLDKTVFNYAYWYAKKRGYQTTASVFDKESLDFLLTYDVPFVKIANRPERRWLIGEVPRKIPVYVSYSNVHEFWSREPAWMVEEPMWCVSKYPATLAEYDEILWDEETGKWLTTNPNLFSAISDHTVDYKVYDKYKPKIIEWHYKLEDSTGPDSGPFARTPEQLKEVL